MVGRRRVATEVGVVEGIVLVVFRQAEPAIARLTAGTGHPGVDIPSTMHLLPSNSVNFIATMLRTGFLGYLRVASKIYNGEDEQTGHHELRQLPHST